MLGGKNHSKSDENLIAFVIQLMDDTLDFSDNKDAVLSQIDELHREHRLKKLREVVDKHNQDRPQGWRIRYDERTSAESLICTLWLNFLPVPPELTFGDHQLPMIHVFMNGHPIIMSGRNLKAISVYSIIYLNMQISYPFLSSMHYMCRL